MTITEAMTAIREIRDQLSGRGELDLAVSRLVDIVESLLLREQAQGLRAIQEARKPQTPVIVGPGFLPQEVPPTGPEQDIPQGPQAALSP